MNLIQWSPGVTLETIEKQVILAAYKFFQQNKTATAQALGIAIRTLDGKLEKYQADMKVEDERTVNERKQRESQLARMRGPHTPNYIATADSGRQFAEIDRQRHFANGTRTPTGTRVEPAKDAPAQHGVSVQERQKVQGVLPQQVAVGNPRKGR